MSESWRYDYMWDSPKGHELEKIPGDADAIWTRGSAVKSLGEQMQMAANTLKLLADDTIGKGLSLDDLRDASEELHGDLRTAGERYAPSGQVLVDYANELSSVQSLIDSVVDDCVELWTTVRSRADAVDTAQSEADAAPDDAPPPTTDPVEAAGGSLNSALDAWNERAGDYDVYYERWDEAYETAVSGLREVNENGVEDGFWDNVAPALEVLLHILEVAGLVLLLAALIIGGPIIAAIATVVALLTLIVTIGLMFSGRKGMKDLAWAVVGVLPFGKLGEFAQVASSTASRGSKLASFGQLFVGADDFANSARIFSDIGQEARTAWNAGSNLVPYAHLSVPSQFLLEGRQAITYLGQHPPQIVNSLELLGARLGGVDSPTSIIDYTGAFVEGAVKNIGGTADTVSDWVSEIMNNSRADSYR